MISLFKKNDFSTLLLLLPFTVALRCYSLLYPTGYVPNDKAGVLSKWLFGALESMPLTQSIIAIGLVYIQAVYINFEINKNKLLLVPSGLPSAFYALFASFFVGLQGLSPELLGMTFVLLACFSAYRVYKRNDGTTPIINSAIYLAIATLFYPPYAVLIVALFVEISILRSFSLREKFQYIFTLLGIYWIIGAFLFYCDTLSLNSLISHFVLFGSIHLLKPVSIAESWPLIVIALGVFITLANYYNVMKKKGMESRKKIDFFYWVMLVSFLNLLLFDNIETPFLLLLAFPLAVLTSMMFDKIKNKYQAELIALVLLLLAFWCQYQDIIPGL